MTSNITAKPIIKLGIYLGIAYTIALYLFYFGGKGIINNESYGSAIQLMTVLGLYVALIYCRKLFPPSSFWKLFLFGIIILAIAILIKTIFTIILYTYLVPELATEHKQFLMKQMAEVFATMEDFPETRYKETSEMMLNSVTIPIMESFSLFITGTFFTVFISALLNMFRR